MINIFESYKFRSLVGIVTATVLFSQWGYFWYAMLLDDLWQMLIGKTELELIALAEQRGLIQSFNTYFISLVQALGLYLVIKISRVKKLQEYLTLLCLIPLLFIIPALGNAVLFAGQSFELWILDSVHFFAGYLLMGGVFWVSLEAPEFLARRRLNPVQKVWFRTSQNRENTRSYFSS